MGGFVVNWKLLWGGTPGVCTLQWNSWFWRNPSQNCVADIDILIPGCHSGVLGAS